MVLLREHKLCAILHVEIPFVLEALLEELGHLLEETFDSLVVVDCQRQDGSMLWVGLDQDRDRNALQDNVHHSLSLGNWRWTFSELMLLQQECTILVLLLLYKD